MKRTKRIAVMVLLAGSLCAGTRTQAQGIPRADSVVKPKAYVSLQAVPQGQTVEVAVVAEIEKGFHVNSNTPKEDYLIPTTVTPQETPSGVRLGAVTYPQGAMKKFEFSDTPLDVYEGTFIVRFKVEVARDAPVGVTRIPLTLRYQACNDRACLPPVKLPVVAELQIAAAGKKPVAQHPNIFRKTKTR